MSYLAHAKFVVCDYTIENRLHYRRDVTLREDHCQVRKGEAPRVLAVLNSCLLAVRLLLGSLLTFK
jgi:predicted transposase YbfD/YdcC